MQISKEYLKALLWKFYAFFWMEFRNFWCITPYSSTNVSQLSLLINTSAVFLVHHIVAVILMSAVRAGVCSSVAMFRPQDLAHVELW